MKFSGGNHLIIVVTYSTMGVALSSQGDFLAAFLAFVVAGAVIFYYEQTLQTQKALELAKECLAGWKNAVERYDP